MSLSARAAGVRYSACLYLFMCGLFCEGNAGMSNRNGPPGGNRAERAPYEVMFPRWLQHVKTHRFSTGEKHPSEVEVWITAEGRDLLLHLQKNKDLFSPAFREIWYSPEGARQTSGPNHQDQCFYHGSVLGWGDSSVAVSTCSGLRGVVSLNSSVSYIIEPLANQTEPWGHTLFRAENLKLPAGTCYHHHGNQSEAKQLRDLIAGMARSHHSIRERRDISRNMKYVELLLVADHAEFVKRGRDREKVKMTLMEAANHVDKFYKTLGVRIAVTGLEVWNGADQISVSENPFTTLSSFLTWRRKQLPHLPNDNAQLITGRPFRGTTIGLAPLKVMCSEYQSGGVNSDHSESVFGVAATLAHELGHNFGMSHDSPGCCQENPDNGGCIMAAATGSPFPRVFNTCNQRELQRYLSSGGGKCLSNPPNPRSRVGGARCGDGYLDEGEECDCGQEEECLSACCNAANCTLKAGAECAHGVCCHNCKLQRPGEVCRPTAGSCDLPEFCDGTSEACPDNHFLLDGSECAGGAYCYTGMCLTLQQQCVSLWGLGARVAPEVCFTEVNKAGDQYGNCGKDLQGNYRRCSQRDAICGKIQCVSGSERPVGSNAVVIPTTVRSGQKSVLCKGTHVYLPGATVSEDTPDPGLVMTGTRCGGNGICFSGECQNASFLRADECRAKCHGHGVCNNRHHCHCDSGWAPPFCMAPGRGGSVDSGPIVAHGTLLPVLLLLLLCGLVGLAVVGIWCCYKHKLHPLKSSAPPAQTSRSCSAPNSRGEAGGHANPTFQLRKPENHNKPKDSLCPSDAPCPRNAVVRPTTKPPPIPAYAQNTHTIKNTHSSEDTHTKHPSHIGPDTDTTNTQKLHSVSPSPQNTHTRLNTHPTQSPQLSHTPKSARHTSVPPPPNTPPPAPPTRPLPHCLILANQEREASLCPSDAPCPRNAVVRPTTKPPPIPAYPQNTHTIKNTHSSEDTHTKHPSHIGPDTDTTNTQKLHSMSPSLQSQQNTHMAPMPSGGHREAMHPSIRFLKYVTERS